MICPASITNFFIEYLLLAIPNTLVFNLLYCYGNECRIYLVILGNIVHFLNVSLIFVIQRLNNRDDQIIILYLMMLGIKTKKIYDYII